MIEIAALLALATIALLGGIAVAVRERQP